MTERPTTPRILIVDDEESTVTLLEKILRRAGYTEIRSTTDPRLTLPLYRDFQPDLIMLDLRMPHLDGLAVMRQLLPRVPEGGYLPIIVISGELDPQAKQQVLSSGAQDFLTKPFDTAEVRLRVRNLLQTRELYLRMEERVRARTEELRTSEIEVAERLALAAELRDYSGAAHTARVGRLSADIARVLGQGAEEVEVIGRAAPLHDIGKIGIPDAILLKPGALTLQEMDIMKTHTTIGARMLAGSSSRILQMAEEIALYHHENWDGTGYTPGLEGEAIPLVGRIVAIADTCDALLHDRPFKSAWGLDDVIAFIEKERGRRFDPAVVDAFLRVQLLEGLPQIEGTDEWEDVSVAFRSAARGAGLESAEGDVAPSYTIEPQ